MDRDAGGSSRGCAAAWVVVTVLAVLDCDVLRAQEADTPFEEVLVTARKRTGAEAAQDVPIALTAFSGEQLESRETRTLQDLSFSMPNVALDDIGTQRGTANFTIRGLGINSSIPSIDPAVGTFVDGMYLGVNMGVVLDMFDVESVEVLRGPQGLLFGRNVTAGAVLIRTRAPTDEFTSSFRISSTDDLDTVAAGVVSGPLVEGKLNGRFAAYYNNDDGWFTNTATGEAYGQSKTIIARPSLAWTPTDTVRLTVRYELADMEGDAPATQNQALFSADTFDFTTNFPGIGNADWQQAIAELNVDVPFGAGVVTNILGWRDYSLYTLGDLDGTLATLFHGTGKIFQDQLSNELRYSGRFFDRMALTTGVHWFTQDQAYFENRILFNGAVNSTLGGVQDHEAFGVFAQADVDITSALTLNLGLRYSEEDKDVQIATFNPLSSACNIDAETCNFDFVDSRSWDDVTPKLGLQYRVNDDAQVYTSWSKGFRSGGYNLRNTSSVNPPGPTDQEELNAYEVGAKADWLGGRLRTNVAVFYNQIDDMQREVNLPGRAAVEQIVRNTADATIQGFDLEAQMALPMNLLLAATYGYTDGEYDEIRFDLSGDGVINAVDYGLTIPRLAKNMWGVSLTHTMPMGIGALTSNVSFSHRDEASYTDNNRGMLSEVDMLNANLGLSLRGNAVRVSIFGKNLLNEVTWGSNTLLPPATFGGPGASFTPLNKGRVVGVQLTYRP